MTVTTTARESHLRFNFGFLLESNHGAERIVEIDFPRITLQELALAPLTGTFRVSRNNGGLYLDGTLHAVYGTECVKCLESFEQKIAVPLQEQAHSPPSAAQEGELVIGEDGWLDLAPVVRQLIVLEMPIRTLCRPDCKGLCDNCGQNFNLGACECPTEEIDPRLAALQQLLNDGESE